MNWFKRNIEVVTYLGAIVTTMIWMNGKFNDVDQKFSSLERDINRQFSSVDKQISSLDKEIAIIKTYLSMKNKDNNELCKNNQEK